MKSIIICFIATILIISNVFAADSANDRIVLKSLDDITSQQIENLISEYVSLSDINIRSFYPYKIKNPIIREALKNLYVVEINEKSDLDNILGQLNNLAEIDYAESYSYPSPLYIPNDPFYYTQWHIPQMAGDLAWDIVRGVQTEIAVIAIIDSGIDYEHPDIGENMWINSSEDINGNGVFDNYPENSGGDLNYFDDDENGFEDDVIGFDLAENDPNPREDALHHGTPVAGIASMATDNDEGAASVGFSARLMAVKVFDEDGNFTEAYNGIIYAADNGAHIINCSWGIPIFRQYEQDIINTVCETGALMVASGGDGQMGQPYYPCAYEGVFCVAPTDEGDRIFYGDPNSYAVDVWAPGVNMLCPKQDEDFEYMSGSSFSSAVASGAAALVKANNPALDAEGIIDALINGADSIGAQNPTYNNPLRINISNALDITGIEDNSYIPQKSSINLNAFPNPFNSTTTFSFALSEKQNIKIEIFDLMGRKVSTLANANYNAGQYHIAWEGTNFSSGIYFARLSGAQTSNVIKLVLMK